MVVGCVMKSKVGYFFPELAADTLVWQVICWSIRETLTVQEKEKIIAIATFLNRQERALVICLRSEGTDKYFFFWLHHGLRDLNFPDQELNPGPQQWKQSPTHWTVRESPRQILFKVIDASWSPVSPLILAVQCRWYYYSYFKVG